MQTTGGRGGSDSYSISSAVFATASSSSVAFSASALPLTPRRILRSASSRLFHLCPAPCLARTGSNPNSNAASSATSMSILYSVASASSRGTRSPREDTVSISLDVLTRRIEESSERLSDRCGRMMVFEATSSSSSSEGASTIPTVCTAWIAFSLASSISLSILSDANSRGTSSAVLVPPIPPLICSLTCARSLQLGRRSF
mmetsp:Transcript_2622/g.7699  ORF Transcript_2622/g.7699 Transcript_2622/m.7699 type:complete len:201 (+) Transcript_2622:4841-5443(+)